MSKITKNQWRVYVILGIMIVVQLACIIFYFHVHKQGYHSDEMWSYGYANGGEVKDISRDEKGENTNMNVWYDTQILRDYIVVNEGEQFHYGDIYTKQIYDLSPPFHSMVLHTICSFFPEQFSRWFSFSINIVSFLVAMIYLFKIAKLISNSDVYALCCCGLYGFSMGARDSYIYLRMYAMCTALVLVIIYNLLQYFKKCKNSSRIFNYNLIIACVVSFLGFLTHYYVVSLMGIFTFVICVMLLFSRKIKLMFTYGLSMLITFLASVVAFPSMFKVSQGNVNNVSQVMDYNFEIRFRVLSNFMMTKLFNIPVSMISHGVLRIVLGCLLFIFIVSIPLLVLLRNSAGMQKLVRKIKIGIKHPRKVLRYFGRRINWFHIALLLTVVGQIIVVGETARVYAMGQMVDRYLFTVYPLVVLIGIALVYRIGMIIFKKRKFSMIIMGLVSVILIGVNIYNCTQYGDYLFRRLNDVNIEDVIADKNCIYIKNDSWMLVTMAPTIMYADEFAQIQYEDYELLESLYNEKAEDGPLMVIVDKSFLDSTEDSLNRGGIEGDVVNDEELDRTQQIYNEILDVLEGLESETDMKHMTTQIIFTRPMEVYWVNP